MFLQLSWTDPATGGSYPQAALVIDDATVHLAAGRASLGVSIYVNADAAVPAAQRAPVYSNPQLVLTPAELDQLRVAFTEQLYLILQQRPAFAQGQIVP